MIRTVDEFVAAEELPTLPRAAAGDVGGSGALPRLIGVRGTRHNNLKDGWFSTNSYTALQHP